MQGACLSVRGGPSRGREGIADLGAAEGIDGDIRNAFPRLPNPTLSRYLQNGFLCWNQAGTC